MELMHKIYDMDEGRESNSLTSVKFNENGNIAGATRGISV